MTYPRSPSFALTVAALSAVALAACDGGDPTGPDMGEILLGIADADGLGFEPVPDGTEVELQPGSQGGFHVWLSLSVLGVDGTVRVEREARRVIDDQLIYRGQRQWLKVPEEARKDWWDSPEGTPAFMCPTPIGIQVFDHEVQFEIRLLDEDDNVLAVDQLVLTPRCPTGEQEAFCRQICDA